MPILIAILMLGILIVLHEFGHFIAAKRSNVRVDEFAVGFPPRIWSFKRGETRYALNLLPIGGYVLMPGENGELRDANGNIDPRSFAVQRTRTRAIILLGGVAMNLLIAIVIYAGIFMAVGAPAATQHAIVESVQSGSPAQKDGLQSHDQIQSINGIAVVTPGDVSSTVASLLKKDPSAQEIAITMDIIRNGSPMTLSLTARRNPPAGQGSIGFSFLPQYVTIPIVQVPGYALHQVFVDNFVSVGEGFHQIIVGTIKVQDAFSGPVGIVQATSTVASASSTIGFAPLFSIMAFISWNLAVFNLLPIPGLDGGRLMLLTIEFLRRGRRLSPEREAAINLAGVGLLLSLLLIFTFNDISHILSSH